jgi:hypothetical protein
MRKRSVQIEPKIAQLRLKIKVAINIVNKIISGLGKPWGHPFEVVGNYGTLL